ncbi:MAG: hypothetical protein PGN13_01880 [Patulibacter minatonensis]
MSRAATCSAVLALVFGGAFAVAGCGGEGQPWKGDADPGRIDDKAVSVAPAATSAPDEPARASTPADAPSPAGTNPDGSSFGNATDASRTKVDAQDGAATLVLRTAMSIIEGCHSGRPSYASCDEQADLGARDKLGLVLGDGVEEVQVSASPRSVRLTTKSKSGARFTVARSPAGDRFSCEPAPGGDPDAGGCREGTWGW